ncbi:MAG: nucleotidyltransferase family protein [Methanothrix sp.]|nr:nucleotidyltransferase family protein [Methanothrix sp.]
MIDIQEIKENIIAILRKHEVKRASLFGSVVRGEASEDSDVDLLVEFEGRKSLLDLIGLKLDLEDRFHRKFDVLTYDSLHPLLKERILKEQVAIL